MTGSAYDNQRYGDSRYADANWPTVQAANLRLQDYVNEIRGTDARLTIPSLRLDGRAASSSDIAAFSARSAVAEDYMYSRDAILRIEASNGFNFGTSLGSGFFVRKDGLIATDLHVVDGAEQIVVTAADGRRYATQLVAQDRKEDLALLKIVGSPYQQFNALQLGDDRTLSAQSTVVGLGHPHGWKATYASPGQTLQYTSFRSVFNFRAELPPPGADLDKQMLVAQMHTEAGDSGAPVLDGYGRVIGICDLSAQSIPQTDIRPVRALSRFLDWYIRSYENT